MTTFWRILALFLLAAIVTLPRTALAGAAGFDCWVGVDRGPYFTNQIRCIADRDLPDPAALGPQSGAILERLHRELRGRSVAAAEMMYQANIDLIRKSRSLWNIVIHSYPSEWSWQEGLPEQLVRSVLCPTEGTCRVAVLRH